MNPSVHRRPMCPARSDRIENAGPRACDRGRSLLGERGFSLIEVVVAMTLFAIVATALAGVLTASIASRSLSMNRTNAEQIANEQIEWIRSLDYLRVGLTGAGQPRGDIDAAGDQASQGGPTVLDGFTVVIKVSWVSDPTPTSYSEHASYKNVRVSVHRTSDGKLLSSQATQVGPRTRASFGGIASGVIEAVVMEYYSGGTGPMPDVTVALLNGPSAPLDDTTNANGAVRFPLLTPTPSSGPTAHYDIDVPEFDGYVLVPNELATHLTLAPGEVAGPKVLHVYKPLTLTIPLFNADGTPFTSNATVRVSNTRGSQTFAYSGSPLTVTEIVNTQTGATETLVPEPYTITVLDGLIADPVEVSVPTDYPTITTVYAPVNALVVGALTTTVVWGGQPVQGATVTITGGPSSITASLLTNSSGVVTFPNLPAGSGYTVTATKLGQSISSSAVVDANGTATLSLALPVGNALARVTLGGSPMTGATLAISGGPMSLDPISATVNANGEVLFSNLPAGAGYTVTASKNGSSVETTATVTSGATASVALAWPTGSLVRRITWLGSNVSGATVTVTGGPNGVSVSQTTPTNGTVTFSGLAVGDYTVTATKSGVSTSATVNVISSTPPTVTMAMPTATISLGPANLTWAGKPVPSATVSLTGGPVTPPAGGSTDSSGSRTITVAATTSANPYTLTVTKGGVTAPAAIATSLAGDATWAPTITFASTATINITSSALQWASRYVPDAGVTITGGPNNGVSYTGTTDWSGAADIVVPYASGAGSYTVTVAKNGRSATATVTASQLSDGAQTPTITITNTKTIRIRVRRGSSNVTSTSVFVSITGGPNGTVGGSPYYQGTYTTDSNGRITAITVPLGTSSSPVAGYTIKVHLTTCSTSVNDSGSASGVSYTATGETAVDVTLTSATCPTAALP